jgi:tol-pal system protein YbgF
MMRSNAARGLRSLWAAALALALAANVGAVGAAEGEATNAELDKRLRRLENIIDSGQLADLIQKLQEMEQRMRELQGQIDQQSHRLDQLRKRQRNLYGDHDRRLRQLEVAGASDEDPSGGEAATGAASGAEAAKAAEQAAEEVTGEGNTSGDAASEQARSDAERKAYDRAFDLLKEGRYDEAAQAFEQFLQKHPDGPYADNAQYWLGESHYVTREFEGALEAFREVVVQYPDSAKVPDARIKIGYSLYELGRLDKAKAMLQKVREAHANSAVSGLAEKRLLKIKRERGEGDGGS